MGEQKTSRPQARIPRGFRDRSAEEIAAERRMLDIIHGVFESYGFEALETPAFEYADALGKFLPDQDRPQEGVFSLEDDDKQWLALRYDLTAPLARYVAENYQNLPKPFRRYQAGLVWRNEKPGPGRFREFTQFDADTVGSASPAADAELVMMTADALEALGLKRGEYVIKLNSRKLLDDVLKSAFLQTDETTENHALRSTVLRAIDKLERLGPDGVKLLLGPGRRDESGDFTKGVGLRDHQISVIMSFVTGRPDIAVQGQVSPGMAELKQIFRILAASGYGDDQIQFDPSIVRGLDYYTGAVFEAQLTFPVKNEAGETIVLGSVAGGGRYDDLIARFTGQQVPATGISIGVSRLLAALRARGLTGVEQKPLIVVLVLDKADVAASFTLARELRGAGFAAEAYVGDGGMKAQLKYADKRGAAVAVIAGADERTKGEVTLKDLALGAELAKSVESRAAWVKDRPAQISVPRKQLVTELRKLLAARKI